MQTGSTSIWSSFSEEVFRRRVEECRTMGFTGVRLSMPNRRSLGTPGGMQEVHNALTWLRDMGMRAYVNTALRWAHAQEDGITEEDLRQGAANLAEVLVQFPDVVYAVNWGNEPDIEIQTAYKNGFMDLAHEKAAYYVQMSLAREQELRKVLPEEILIVAPAVGKDFKRMGGTILLEHYGEDLYRFDALDTHHYHGPNDFLYHSDGVQLKKSKQQEFDDILMRNGFDPYRFKRVIGETNLRLDQFRRDVPQYLTMAITELYASFYHDPRVVAVILHSLFSNANQQEMYDVDPDDEVGRAITAYIQNPHLPYGVETSNTGFWKWLKGLWCRIFGCD